MLDIEYFNLEANPSGTTLVFNASKKGLTSFLKKYGHLETPPLSISFKEWLRPQRVWKSRHVYENKNALSTDPSPYCADSTDALNILFHTLHIQFLADSENKIILAAGYRESVGPILIVNKRGWKKFLEILNHLLNKCYWFYVTHPHNPSLNLPFTLTTPYPGEANDVDFKAIECIRLEPEEHIYLDVEIPVGRVEITNPSKSIKHIALMGNSAGLLLCSSWLREFVQGGPDKVFNYWNDILSSVYRDRSREGYVPPQHFYFYFHKTCLDKTYPVLGFGTEIDQHQNFQVFGNIQGLLELADLLEAFAFEHDHDDYITRAPNIRCKGDLSPEVIPPSGIQLVERWSFYEGGIYNPAYSDYVAEPDLSAGQIVLDFVNKRIVYDTAH